MTVLCSPFPIDYKRELEVKARATVALLGEYTLSKLVLLSGGDMIVTEDGNRTPRGTWDMKRLNAHVDSRVYQMTEYDPELSRLKVVVKLDRDARSFSVDVVER